MAEPIAEVGYLAGLCARFSNAWKKLVCDADGYLKVTMPYEEALGARAYHYDGESWHKSNLLWGFNAPFDVDLGGTAETTTYGATSGAVPANELWVLQAISIANLTRATTSVSISLARASGSTLYLNFAANLATFVPLLITGAFTLAEGDAANVFMQSTQADDEIQAGLCGYKMKLNM